MDTDDAAQLLSDYEDACYASCRHAAAAVVPGADQESERAHLIEALRLHADVRRLRAEVLWALTTPTG